MIHKQQSCEKKSQYWGVQKGEVNHRFCLELARIYKITYISIWKRCHACECCCKLVAKAQLEVMEAPWLRATLHKDHVPWPWKSKGPWKSSKGRTMGYRNQFCNWWALKLSLKWKWIVLRVHNISCGQSKMISSLGPYHGNIIFLGSINCLPQHYFETHMSFFFHHQSENSCAHWTVI